MDNFSLSSVQRWMQSVIVHPGGVQAGLAAEATQEHLLLPPDDVEQLVSSSQMQTSIERLAVYANAYHARLIECMESEFPVFRHAVGEETFAEFVVDYLQRYPSQSYSLGHLGNRFPAYLAATKPAAESANAPPGWADFLVELAVVERAFSEVFDGMGVEGQVTLQADRLQLDPKAWANSRLGFVPCFRLLELQFPTNEYYAAVRQDESPLVPAPTQSWLAITRRDFIVRRYDLSRPQFVLLRSLQSGNLVAHALADAAEFFEGDLNQFTVALRRWFADWAAAPFFAGVV